MPGGDKYPGPAEALERYRAAVELAGIGELKGAKNPYTSLNGHMFSFLDVDGVLAIRLSDELETEFRSQYDSEAVTQYGRTMQGYSSVPSELLADATAISEWIRRAWEWVGSLPPKPTKKPKK